MLSLQTYEYKLLHNSSMQWARRITKALECSTNLKLLFDLTMFAQFVKGLSESGTRHDCGLTRLDHRLIDEHVLVLVNTEQFTQSLTCIVA